MPATTAHGFRFTPQVTDGWVVSFTEDVTDALGDQSGEALARLKAVAADPVLPLANAAEARRLATLCAELNDEASLAREGYRLAMRGLLALIAIEVVRLGVSRARSGAVTLSRADARVEALRLLLDEHFRKERLISFYAEKLAMTPDRLNDHVKRATGVTAGHLIRQRVLTEAKRQLGVHQPADPRDRLRSGVFRSVALHAIFPQADRHDAAGVPRGAGRLTLRAFA